MPLPQWMDGFPGAPSPGQPDNLDGQDDEVVGTTPCRLCSGEGCQRCNGTDVIYP